MNSARAGARPWSPRISGVRHWGRAWPRVGALEAFVKLERIHNPVSRSWETGAGGILSTGSGDTFPGIQVGEILPGKCLVHTWQSRCSKTVACSHYHHHHHHLTLTLLYIPHRSPTYSGCLFGLGCPLHSQHSSEFQPDLRGPRIFHLSPYRHPDIYLHIVI